MKGFSKQKGFTLQANEFLSIALQFAEQMACGLQAMMAVYGANDLIVERAYASYLPLYFREFSINTESGGILCDDAKGHIEDAMSHKLGLVLQSTLTKEIEKTLVVFIV